MIGNSFGDLLAAHDQQKAIRAKMAMRQHELEAMAYEVALTSRCVKNYHDFHGLHPPQYMRRAELHFLYDMPWRKSPIPKVSRKGVKQ